MLAAASDYTFIWQLPLVLIFLFGWIVGGGALFHRALSPHLTKKKKKTFLHGVFISLVSGTVAGIGGMIAMFVGSEFLPKSGPVSIIALILAGVVLWVVWYLVVYAMHDLPGKLTMKLAWVPITSVFLLGAVVATACAVPAYRLRMEQVEMQRRAGMGLQNLSMIYGALRGYPSQGAPKSLEELIEKELIEDGMIKNPLDPDRAVGFFYFPQPINRRIEKKEMILACSYSIDEAPRLVLLMGGEVASMGEGSFESYLERPENKAFAEAYLKSND